MFGIQEIKDHSFQKHIALYVNVVNWLFMNNHEDENHGDDNADGFNDDTKVFEERVSIQLKANNPKAAKRPM